MSTSVVFETHSITEDNEAGVATGWLPGRLSPRGRELARELGSRRRDDGLSAVFTSDLVRAAETVSVAFGGTGIPVLQDWRLRGATTASSTAVPARWFTVTVSPVSTVPTPAVKAGARP